MKQISIYSAIIMISLTVVSCSKNTFSKNHFKNSGWKITKAHVLPISNEFGDIQCVEENEIDSAGGIVFDKKNGRIAYINPLDSTKTQFEFSFSENVNESGDVELNLGDLNLTFEKNDISNGVYNGYFEETNPCGDVYRIVFYLQKYDIYSYDYK